MMLKTPDGDEFEAYVAGPEESKRAVLILHDWWGVLEYNQAWADRLAALGYRAMVVDLYDGERARTVEEAGEKMRRLDQDLADAKLITAIAHLSRNGAKVATLGWSLGGRQALQAALLAPEEVCATILFYCRLITDAQQLAQLGGPVLVFYAQQEQTWPAKMDNFTKGMAAAAREVQSVVFDAGHGFVNPTSDRYHAAFAEQAWQTSVAFLGRVFA